MPIYARKKEGEYSTAPEGLWAGVCVDVIDLGVVESMYGPKPKIKIVWQLEEKDPKTGRRFQVQRRFTPSLHEKAALRQTLESWRGRKFTKDEEREFDIENLLGANCQLQIVHNIKDEGETYANIQAIVPPARNSVKLRAEDYVRFVDREKHFEDHPNGNGNGNGNHDESTPF